MRDFAGRFAVVTGGGTGMGRELARQLIAEGCSVAMCDVSAKTMAQTIALCEADVFTLDDPHAIALSLKRSAEASRRRKGSAFQSAMSMLTFYINRAGHNLTEAEKRKLEAAKDELRHAFGRDKA